MKKLAVLGCGLVGSTIVRDLAEEQDLEITAADASQEALDRLAAVPRVTTRRADLSSPDAIRSVVRDADAVVGAVPGRLGLMMLEAVIAEGKPISDISFAPEDPFVLDVKAKERGVTVVVDCGVSPGLSNLAIGRAASRLDRIDEATIYVGGLPAQRYWPYEYRSVFSPTDVIEEYLRPARLIEAHQVVTRPALSEIELIDFPGVGTLEAFNTDGLRTLLHTVEASSMKEKTLRYPGHAERMRMLRDSGFFSDEPVEIDGTPIVPRRLSEKLLFAQWRRPEKEEEWTLLRVEVSGTHGSRRLRTTFDLFDRTDMATGATSMARTTGFPCAIMARMIVRGEYHAPGIRPPESFGGDDGVYETLLNGLRQRGVRLEEHSSEL